MRNVRNWYADLSTKERRRICSTHLRVPASDKALNEEARRAREYLRTTEQRRKGPYAAIEADPIRGFEQMRKRATREFDEVCFAVKNDPEREGKWRSKLLDAFLVLTERQWNKEFPGVERVVITPNRREAGLRRISLGVQRAELERKLVGLVAELEAKGRVAAEQNDKMVA